MKRYKLEIEYKGTKFSGWQIQPNSTTIEGVIEATFARILQQPIDIVGQGRTDAGVHAEGQIAHVDLPRGTNLKKVIRGVNGLIGEEIFIKSSKEVETDFHSRFDATSRRYQYRLLKYPAPMLMDLGWFPGDEIDLNLLQNCAELLVGEHDFDGFSRFNEENYTTLCSVLEAVWKENDESYLFEIESNRFLRNMVRRLVGTMVEVSKGKISVEEFERILANQEEAPATFTAPAKGLILKKVFYKNE